MNPNPFTELEQSDGHVRIPTFPRNKKFTIRISHEANDQIVKLIKKYTPYNEDSPEGYATLLELIGMYALTVKPPTPQIDEESQVTTEDCRQSGFEDALEGNPAKLLQLYNIQLSSEFEEQYLRGWFEGNFVRNKR